MSENKTIDGLAKRKANSSRAVRFKDSPRVAASKRAATSVKMAKQPTKKPAAAPTLKPTPKKPAPSPDKAHDDFLKPVETFDFNLEDTDLKDEQKNLKKSKKADKKADKKAKKAKKKAGKARKIITSILLIIVLLLIGGVVWLAIWGNDIIARLTGGSSNIWDAIGALTSENYVDLKTAEDGRTNILIFGTSGFDMEGTSGDYTHDGAQLTDSIMALSFDQYSGDVAMVSLPRDLKVYGACYAGKINEVYTCNNEDGNNEAAGAEALEETVSEVLGLDFQYYVHLNWQTLIDIVDTLGGITVTLDEDIDDYGWTNIKIEAGVPTTINGWDAVGLARARHGTEGGDFTRGTSQQKIIIALKDKITERFASGSLSLMDAVSIISSLGDNLRSNITIEEIKTAAHLAQTLDFDSMRQVYLVDYKTYTDSYMTTATINGISYVVPVAGVGNYSSIHQLIAREFNADPVIREAAQVIILNGTDTDGLAATEAAELQAEGYNVTTGNAPEGDYGAAYTIYLINPDAATATAKTLKGFYNAEIKSASDLPAGIDPTGYDIVLLLGNVSKAE